MADFKEVEQIEDNSWIVKDVAKLKSMPRKERGKYYGDVINILTGTRCYTNTTTGRTTPYIQDPPEVVLNNLYILQKRIQEMDDSDLPGAARLKKEINNWKKKVVQQEAK